MLRGRWRYTDGERRLLLNLLANRFCASGTKIFMVFKVVLVLAYWRPFEFQVAVFEHKMLTFRLQESGDVLLISSCLRHDAYEEIQTSREEDVQLLSIHFLFPSHGQQMSKRLFIRDSTTFMVSRIFEPKPLPLFRTH